MKPSKMIEALQILIEADQPTMMWSGPGVGKSSLVYQLGKKLNRKVIEIRATLIDPIDLKWEMTVVSGKLVFRPPSFFPDEENCILFIDELPTALPLVQAALYQLVLDRKLGGHELPKGTRIIAAGNRETDRAAVQRMPTPLANRFTHIDLEFDNKDWEVWAIDTDQPIELVAWNRFKPGRINAFDPMGKEKAQPTPRSWEFVGKIINQTKDRFMLYELVKGTVGQADAIEFCSFVEDWKLLPDPRKVLAEPDSAEIPTKPSVLFSLGAALAKMVEHKNSENFFRYAERLKESGLGDHAVAMIHDATTRESKLKECFGYTNWITKYGAMYAS